MADLLAAQVQRESRVTKGTRDKEHRVWKRWLEYTKCINFEHDIWLTYLTPEIEYTKCINFEHDIWLTYLTPESRTAIFGAFAAAL